MARGGTEKHGSSEMSAAIDLQTVVSEIADEMRAADGPRRGRDLYSRAGARRRQVLRPRGGRCGRQRRRGGDSETPFSIQSISKVFTLTLALGQGRRPAVAARRPRAVGQPVQFHRPARIRARHAAQSVHQCRRHCRHRRDPVRASARARRWARSCGSCAFSPTIHRSRSTRRSRPPSSAPAFATARLPTT